MENAGLVMGAWKLFDVEGRQVLLCIRMCKRNLLCEECLWGIIIVIAVFLLMGYHTFDCC